MKRIVVFFISITIILGSMYTITAKAHASDYQGTEDRGSIFQVIGDFITGKYEVDNKPLKEKGVLQAIADETKKMQPASSK